MNEIINKFLLARDKFMQPGLIYRQNLNIVLANHLQNTKKESKNFKKLDICNIIIKTN